MAAQNLPKDVQVTGKEEKFISSTINELRI